MISQIFNQIHHNPSDKVFLALLPVNMFRRKVKRGTINACRYNNAEKGMRRRLEKWSYKEVMQWLVKGQSDNIATKESLMRINIYHLYTKEYALIHTISNASWRRKLIPF